jgi:CDP-diacylglycerol--glycerol-3-phosphate 3-phosphatidyltransferase
MGAEMANAITLFRLTLLFVLVAMAYWAAPHWQLVDAPLLLLIIALDGLDGWVARRRGEASTFGAVFDIAVDRVVEAVLWLVLAHLGLVPVWVAIVFITRGLIVDAVRYGKVAEGEAVFSMRSRLGRFLVASRFMRGAYGALKAATFGWLFLIQPWPLLHRQSWMAWEPLVEPLTAALIYATVAVCLARGLPVIVEFVRGSDAFGGIRAPSKRAPYDLPPQQAA